MDWSLRPLSESLKVFKARMNLYLEDQNITDLVKQATKIKIASGDEGMRRILHSGMTDEDQKKPSELWKLLENEVEFTVKISFRVHRLEFSNIRQENDENTQQYLSRLREKALKCKFEPDELNERLIEMVILSTPHEEIRKELLIKPYGYKVSDLLERAREVEAILTSQASLLSMKNNVTPIQKIDALRESRKRSCQNCGLSHPPKSCPAYRDTCHGCGNKGHWIKFCKKKTMVEDIPLRLNNQDKNNYQLFHVATIDAHSNKNTNTIQKIKTTMKLILVMTEKKSLLQYSTQ